MSGQLPILMVPVTNADELVAKAISDRGLDRSVYDFIKHNWGVGAANVAMLTAEQQKPVAPSGTCGCGE